MATIYTQRTYTETEQAKQAWQALEEALSSKPGEYDSKWLSQLDTVLGQILERPAFQYDPYTDPLYRQHRDNYVNQGRMAMMDTLGQAAALTGGYGNSYGQVAGQQAYHQSLAGLNDVIPELYQLALETYDRNSQQLLDSYGVLADREALDYGRYQDNYGLWQDQRDFLADRYDAERDFGYSQYRDDVGDDQWLAAFQEDVRRFDFANKLGEFAQRANAPSGGGGGGSTSRSKKRKPKDEEEKTASKSTPAASKPSSYPHIVLPDKVKPSLYTMENK